MALGGLADVFLFNDFRFDRRGGGLFKLDGGAVIVGSRALDVLSVLIERAGDLVSKDEIMRAVWPGTVVEDGNLTVQISTLRRVLDRGRTEGSCIQTVAGKGYRFVEAITLEHRSPHRPMDAAIVPCADATDAARCVAVPPLPVPNPAFDAARLPIRPVLLLLAVMLLFGGAGWLGVKATGAAGRSGVAVSRPSLSIVVLPFTNLSRDPDQEYFADALTEDLTTDLSRLAGSFVISRNTAFTYKGKPTEAKQVGQQLGVRYLLEGAVQRSDKQLRVSAQLIDAETGAHLWAERIDRDYGDPLVLQNEVAGRIGNALNVQLSNAEASRRATYPDALQYIFRGRAAYNKGMTRSNYAEAISHHERALALDPGSSMARIFLATMLAGRTLDDMTDTAADDIARGEELIEQALQEVPHNPQAHFARGQLLRLRHRCADAIAEYESALAGNPNWAMALAHIGRCKIRMGLLDEAIPLHEQALRLSPADPGVFNFYQRVGEVHLLQSRTGEAIRWFEKARSKNPAFPGTHTWLAAAYAISGDIEPAMSELAEARRLKGNGSYESIAQFVTSGVVGVSAMRPLYERTYFAGLRALGVQEN